MLPLFPVLSSLAPEGQWLQPLSLALILLLMLSLILILNCRSIEPTHIQLMSFLHYLSNNKNTGFGGTGGGSKKLQESQKGITNKQKWRNMARREKKLTQRPPTSAQRQLPKCMVGFNVFAMHILPLYFTLKLVSFILSMKFSIF